MNVFSPYKTGTVLSEIKGPGKLVLGTTVEYKKVFRLQPGKYVQVNQYDEPRNTIDKYWTVGAIVLGPQYNIYGGYLFEILLTGKRLWHLHWNPINMTEYMI